MICYFGRAKLECSRERISKKIRYNLQNSEENVRAGRTQRSSISFTAQICMILDNSLFFFVEIEAEYAQTNKIKHHPELSKRFLLY